MPNGEPDRDAELAIEEISRIETSIELARIMRDLRRRDARRRGGKELTYRELAAKTGWSIAVIGEYLAGKTLPPTERFDALVQLLGAGPTEQSALATARDRVQERRRGVARPAGLGGVRLGGASIVGRRDQVAALRVAVEAAAQGYGGTVFLVGEAGVGKTRLASEAATLATEAGLRVLRGRATLSAVQFRPISEALLSALRKTGIPESAELIPYRPALSRLVPEWRWEHRDGADDSMVVLAEAVLRLVLQLGRPHGCLLILEDLHEADADTLSLVDYLIDNAAQEPFLLVATVRTEASPALDLARATQRRRSAEMIELTRLPDESVRQLAGICLDAPPEQIPEPVVTRLLTSADGLPLHVEELLAGMVGDQALTRVAGQWTLVRPLPSQLPVTLTATIAGRAERLSARTRALLHAAAVFGQQFSADTAAAAIGMSGLELLSCLREAVDAQLVVPTDDPRLYAFRHTLTAEALRAQLLPVELAALSRNVAQAIEDSVSTPVKGWERLAGELWLAAGEPRRAAELLGAAGRRAAAQGAVSTGISLLERAFALADRGIVDDLVADLGKATVDAYAIAGRIADAYAIGKRLDGDAEAGRRAMMHLGLARVASAAGQWEQGLHELAKARRLLDAGVQDTAAAARVDVVAADLVLGNPTTDRHVAAQRLAQRALDAAEASGQADVACSALEVLGRCARVRDLAEADAIYERGLAVAEANGLVGRKIGFLYQIGAHDGVRSADPVRLRRALTVATEAGAVVTALDIELELAMVQICRTEFDDAAAATKRCEQTAGRLRLTDVRLRALGERIMTAAHRADRSEVDRLMTSLKEIGGDTVDYASAVHGFGLAFCCLLEEDGEQARAELRIAAELDARRPTSYLSLVHGPGLLLSVLDGDAGHDDCVAMQQSGQIHAGWNQQFVALAQAVVAGRSGRADEAGKHVTRFLELSKPYPHARHLGLRLVAPVAIEQGWGDPVSWLRAVETYFHLTATNVARACRTMLRRLGVPVPQHRQGSDGIPTPVRKLGVTVREYEVLRLVGQHLSNVEIGRRLFLSPRTVEKHVASLLVKTGQANRARLVGFAVDSTASSIVDD